MNILTIGDIVSRPGRKILKSLLTKIKSENNIDICIANGENAATGNGITSKVTRELYSYGVDIITLGNHTWAKPELEQFIDGDQCMIRPANYVDNLPGQGSTIYYKGAKKIGVINLCGRVYYGGKHELECPFKSAISEIEKLKETTNIILVDFHAEATSEKIALGWYLDGKVSVVFGTHTHVQTRDERILPGGTGYISDIGMTGPYNSVLGLDKDVIINRFITGETTKFVVAEGEIQLNGMIFTIDDKSGKCTEIKAINHYLK